MVFNMSIEEWDAVINVHLRGAFCVVKPACVLMRAQKSGCIINFSSISAAGNSGQANYSAAKAGILGLTRTVARDMAKYGVRANAIWPGANTRMTATVPESARQIRAERGIGQVHGCESGSTIEAIVSKRRGRAGTRRPSGPISVVRSSERSACATSTAQALVRT